MIDAKKENKIIFICWLAYAVAYVGRLNFTASIVAIISDLGIEKPEAGLVGSFFFFAYGVGQLVNGVLSKRYNSRIMVFFALVTSAVLNILMPFSGNISVMKYLWLANGAVQSILWCTLIKTISEYVSTAKMPTAIMVMSTPNTFGTFAVYGLSALFVKFFNWKYTFFTAAALLLMTAFIWFILYGNDKPAIVFDKSDEIKESGKAGKMAFIAVMATIAAAGIANGFIKDGINTWVPSLLYEEFKLSQSFSILLTLLLPLVATLSAGVIKKIHDKIESHIVMNLILFAVSAVMCAGIIVILRIHSIVVIMVLFMAVSAIMAMINNVITSMFPLDRRALISSGFAAGLLNTFCYVGSTISTYSLGVAAQKGGWNLVFIIMAGVSAAGLVFSLAGSLFDRRGKEKTAA